MPTRPRLDLPPVAERIYGEVGLDLHAGDLMYAGNLEHYLLVGANALGVIQAGQQLAGVGPPRSILDFGCGAGRVTRWLRAAFPDARISASDIREDDLKFCADRFSVEVWRGGSDVAALKAPGRYDIIWACSVLTHLPQEQAEGLVHKFVEWTEPGGLIFASLHGRRAIELRGIGQIGYIGDAAWEKIRAGYDASGYGYADYQKQRGYGISLCSLNWVADLVLRLKGMRLVFLGERSLDNHQDVVCLQRTD
jgi:SAM-dependent methyltransferase